MSLAQHRADRMTKVAESMGINSKVRVIGGKIYAHVNGVTFLVTSHRQFIDKCEELKDYVAPAPIDLTERFQRIEEKTMRKLGGIR